jgi:uncharacterized lipoprotein YajG
MGNIKYLYFQFILSGFSSPVARSIVKNNIATKVFVSILLLFVVVAQKKTKIKQNIDASSKQQMCRNAFNHRFHSLTNRIECPRKSNYFEIKKSMNKQAHTFFWHFLLATF